MAFKTVAQNSIRGTSTQAAFDQGLLNRVFRRPWFDHPNMQ